MRVLCGVLLLPLLLCAQSTAPVYPLDPLSHDEIIATVATLTKAGKIHSSTRIGMINLHEPSKSDVLASLRGGPPCPRTATVVIYDWSTGVESDGVVDPHSGAVVSWTDLPPADPPPLYLSIARATEIAKADARFRAAMARHGYADVSRILVNPNVASDYVLQQHNGDRVTGGLLFDADAPDFGASHGLFAMQVWENLTRGTIDSLTDTAAASELRMAYTPPTPERGVAPVANHIEIRGSAIRWGHWRLRVGIDPRRGLELYEIGFEDKGAVRSILYRSSISEMIAPYGDPTWGSWLPMDESEVGLAIFGDHSATPGEDAPPDAAYLPAVFADDRGRPVEVPRAIAVFERQTDVLWRHQAQSHRARELVVRGYTNAENYDYVFDWIFREDGSIQVQAALTGVVNHYLVAAQQQSADTADGGRMFSHLVAHGVHAPIHQHFFSYRLDFDIDRPDHNRVIELTASALPAGPDNAQGEWFAAHARAFRTEQDAIADSTPDGWRRWIVTSSRDTNALGQPTGYALIPDALPPLYASPASAAARRAPFVAHELWVTPYAPDEMYAAGEVPSRDAAPHGLARWTAQNRSIGDTDVVLWYTLGVTHLPRTEDYPVMPTYVVGFRLVPTGFFSHDPAL